MPTTTGVPLKVSTTVIVLPGSAVPVIVSLLSLVMRSPAVPVSCDTLITVGASGFTVSMTTLIGCESGEVLPAPSVAVAVKVWPPSASGAEGVMVHEPSALTIAVPTRLVPS